MALVRLMPALALGPMAACTLGAQHPVLPVTIDEDSLDSYREALAPLLEMSEEEMLALVPTQSGLYFCDCPSCTAGRQEGQFSGGWSIEQPDVMHCPYCGHVYPSDKYPMTEALEVENPVGETQRYPYWADGNGYRHFFAARIDYHKIRYMEQAANTLARVYALTQDKLYARRSALIMHRFAQVYPGYCYHYDYPFVETVIYQGEVDPKDFRSGFRTARWTWWAYMDIPALLVEAYDLIAESGELQKLSGEMEDDVAAAIETFFVATSEQVLANRDPLSNMSPGMWADVIRVGRVLGKPEYVHTAVGRLRRLVTERFFYDGSWQEGAPSYHRQVVGGLSEVFRVAKGYSDPPGFTHAATGERFDELDIENDLPAVVRAQEFVDLMRLPNGRLVPVHDTWSTNRRGALSASRPFLLPGLGHACLAQGEGEQQTQVHLTWSPGYGHRHYDGLSLLLFAYGKELLSDIGYTHTKAKPWSLATASHNTVVVDHENQAASGGEQSTYGALRYFDASSDMCQAVSVDNPQVYPALASRFRRTLALVPHEQGASYLVDCFQAEGGNQHDYFLHGSADEPQSLTASVGAEAASFEPLGSLVPAGLQFVPAEHEGEGGKVAGAGYAYGYLGDLRRCVFPARAVAVLDYGYDGEDVGLRAHLLVQDQDTLVVGASPAVRPAKEDDDALDQYKRQFAMLRRIGGTSRFVSLMEPYAGEPAVAAVTTLDLEGAGAAVQVEMADGGRDLILLDADGVETEWLGKPLKANGELIVLSARDGRAAWATVVLGSVEWDGLVVGSPPITECRLLATDRGTGSLLVEGAFTPAVGSIISVDHAGRRVSPYTVVSSAREEGNTRVRVAEDVGFEWDPATKTARFVVMPQLRYAGEHIVREAALAHRPGR